MQLREGRVDKMCTNCEPMYQQNKDLNIPKEEKDISKVVEKNSKQYKQRVIFPL